LKEIVVISGKGGTGKTTVAASLAVLAAPCAVADADVDAPDMHLLLHPRVLEQGAFSGGSLAVRDPALCTHCGRCREVCRFDAIGEGDEISALECEGCGACTLVCPQHAITMQDRVSGRWIVSQSPCGPMAHARLVPGSQNSGKLVTLVRRKARELAKEHNASVIITDGPPGIGCAVIAAVGGAATAVVVTEPTVSGLHDLERVLRVCKHFSVPAAVCVNKSDLNPAMADSIRDYCKQHEVPVLGDIPYDPEVAAAIRAGTPLVQYGSGPAALAVRDLWEQIRAGLRA